MIVDDAGASDPLLPFVTHVVTLWRGARSSSTEQTDAARDLRALVAASSADAAGRDPAHAAEREARIARLLADPVLLAAIFQNIDLLYAHRSREAPGVSALVMTVMERARDAERGSATRP